MTSTEPADTRSRSVPRQLFSMRAFRRVWLAGAMSGIMRWLDMLAVALFVLEVTGSPFLVALALFLRMVPMFLFGAVAGAVAEKVNRRNMLIVAFLVVAAVYTILAWLSWNGTLQLWQLGMGVFLSGILWAMEFSVRRPIVADIAGLDRIGAAMGLESSTNNFTRMLGPLSGGFLFEFFGLPGTLILAVILLTSAALLLMTVPYESAPKTEVQPSIINTIIEGLQFVRSNRIISATLTVTVLLNIFGFSFVSMVPVIARENLGLSASPTGILASADGAGAFIGCLLIAFYANPRRFQQIFISGAIIYLCCVIAFSLSAIFELSFILMLAAGFGISGFTALQSALVISYTPPEMRSRLMGVVAMCIGVGPLGVLFVGLLATQVGASTAVFITAVMGFLAIIGCAFIWPEMRRIKPT
ncbi:MAG: MFS transporter [Proteobacteria bacterium]|nr:MFS transporter [Pseudomonadota bacterium]